MVCAYLYGVSLCSSCSGWLVQSSQWLKLRTFRSHCTMLVSWIIFSCHIASFILIYSKVTEGSSNTFKILSHHSLSQRSLSIIFFYIFFHFLFHSFSILLFFWFWYFCMRWLFVYFWSRSSSLLPIFKRCNHVLYRSNGLDVARIKFDFSVAWILDQISEFEMNEEKNNQKEANQS